jgi:hypothetical protein
MNKKGDIGWDFIGKMLFYVMMLVVLLAVIGLIADKSFGVVDKLKEMLGF